MPQLITIGETMAAFTPDSVGALRYVQNFGIRTAGAESNVAVGLAKLGLEAAWVSRLGTDEFGCFIRNQLRAEGVDCSRVIYDPDHRTGIMFKETSVGETKVFYYRENSAASHGEASIPIAVTTSSTPPRVPAVRAISSFSSAWLRFSLISVNTGTKAVENEPSANSRRMKLGMRKATKNASVIAFAPK